MSMQYLECSMQDLKDKHITPRQIWVARRPLQVLEISTAGTWLDIPLKTGQYLLGTSKNDSSPHNISHCHLSCVYIPKLSQNYQTKLTHANLCQSTTKITHNQQLHNRYYAPISLRTLSLYPLILPRDYQTSNVLRPPPSNFLASSILVCYTKVRSPMCMMCFFPIYKY